jgi:ribulose-5-phosphate 4-epimerase/fuculose-1-phosphate aldolase
MASGLDELKEKIVLAHRMLAMTGSMVDVTGHVFVRVPESNDFLARCRNSEDWSPAFVEPAALHRVNLDGDATEELQDYVLPPERYIATEVFKARPDVNCIIHAHPPAQVFCSVAEFQIRPIVGLVAPYTEGTKLALQGIPVYPRSILVASVEEGSALAKIMGDKDVCFMRGHGNVVAGRTIEQASMRAIQLENLARVYLKAALAGLQIPDVAQEDVEEQLRPTQTAVQHVEAFSDTWLWRYYERLVRDGVTRHDDLDI